MHPNGQIPAYEFAFSDVNPPVHAWAVWRVYKMTGKKGNRDVAFLERAFHKLMLNFTWWVNRKDISGKHLFAGGFLGLDNIGIFDRSKPLPGGFDLEQADGTAWMAFYCSTMLAMALELAMHNGAVRTSPRSSLSTSSRSWMRSIRWVGRGFGMSRMGSTTITCTQTGTTPLRVRSLVGLVPLFAAEIFEQETFDRLPGFTKTDKVVFGEPPGFSTKYRLHADGEGQSWRRRERALSYCDGAFSRAAGARADLSLG